MLDLADTRSQVLFCKRAVNFMFIASLHLWSFEALVKDIGSTGAWQDCARSA
jgi:hypothetical protein